MSGDLTARLTEAAQKYADYGNAEEIAAAAALRLASRKQRGYKVCPRCQQEKKPSEFGADSRERDGLRRACRECRKTERVNADLA